MARKLHNNVPAMHVLVARRATQLTFPVKFDISGMIIRLKKIGKETGMAYNDC